MGLVVGLVVLSGFVRFAVGFGWWFRVCFCGWFDLCDFCIFLFLLWVVLLVVWWGFVCAQCGEFGGFHVRVVGMVFSVFPGLRGFCVVAHSVLFGL